MRTVEASRALRGALLIGAPLLAGCTLDITRVRGGSDIVESEYEALSENLTTRAETLELLGTPDKVEWKLGKDYWWYFYADYINVGLRFQIPPPPFDSFFGYRHNVLRLSEESDVVSSLALVFDEEEVLRQKSLRLSEAYTPPDPEAVRSRFVMTPRFQHSVELFGDGDAADYDDIFTNGYRAGIDIGWQAAPVATVFIGGSYQEHQGDGFTRAGSRIDLDDLHLYQLEIGIRLSAPIGLMAYLTDFDRVMRELFLEDLRKTVGWRIYFQGTTGITVNEPVNVKIDDVPSGQFYDNGFGFSGMIGGGIEYSGDWASIHVGVDYQSIEAFEDGNTDLDDDGSAFQALLVGAGVTLKF